MAPDLDLWSARASRRHPQPRRPRWSVAHRAWRAQATAAAEAGFAARRAAAYGSHVLLDWLGVDTLRRSGVPALWPFDAAYLQAPWQPFVAVSRRFHEPGLFGTPNALAIGREILILAAAADPGRGWRRRHSGPGRSRIGHVRRERYRTAHSISANTVSGSSAIRMPEVMNNVPTVARSGAPDPLRPHPRRRLAGAGRSGARPGRDAPASPRQSRR